MVEQMRGEERIIFGEEERKEKKGKKTGRSQNGKNSKRTFLTVPKSQQVSSTSGNIPQAIITQPRTAITNWHQPLVLPLQLVAPDT